jgi:hypothetical protein
MSTNVIEIYNVSFTKIGPLAVEPSDDGQTGRYDKGNGRFLQLFSRSPEDP